MKILLVKSFPKLTSVGNLAKELGKRGHDVHVVIPRNHSDSKEMKAFGIKMHAFGFFSPRDYHSCKNIINTPTFKKIVTFLKKESFDVINLNLPQARKVWGMAAYVSGKGITTSTVRGFEKRYNKMSNYFDEAIISVSEALKQHLVSKGIPKNIIYTIPNGLDVKEINFIPEDKLYLHKELGLDPKIKIIGMIAYFYNYYSKGHKIFLDAAKVTLKEFPNARFVLVGDNIDVIGIKEHFENYAQKLRIKDKVFFLGERNDIFSIISSLYMCVLPSQAEGCANVLLEAMARRIPNIASRIKSIEEIVDDGKTGILFEPGKVKSLAKSIKILLDNPELAEKMGIAGYKKLGKDFLTDKIAIKYEQLFRKLINKRKLNAKT